jgi:hypothetical protein
MALLPHVRDPRVSYEDFGGKVSFSSRRRFSLARLRRTVFLPLMILPGGGSSLRTRANPGGIRSDDGVNESSAPRKRHAPASPRPG